MSPSRPTISVRWLAVLSASFASLSAVAWLFSAPLGALLSSLTIQASDRAAWNLAHELSTSMLLGAASMSNYVHGTVGILVLTAALAWAWTHCGRPQARVRLLVAVPVGMLLNVAVKAAIHRVRPSWSIVDLPASFSFPSGHVAEATVFYGSLAIEVAKLETSRLQKALCVAGAATMIAIVASSRIIVGVHFLSDCIGALGEGLLWLAACFSRPPLTPAPMRENVR
ncbi:MAG: phosphatase PAP2 family protein [Burkholderiaceae bacterium]